MLRFPQSAATSSSTSSPHNAIDMTVLERQRSLLYHRLHWQHHQETHPHLDPRSLAHEQNQQLLFLSQNWLPVKTDDDQNAANAPALLYPEMNLLQGSHSAVSNSINSSMSTMPNPEFNNGLVKRDCKVSSSVKKRKAEFDVEEEGHDKGVEAEEAEQSEITVKTDKEISTNTCSKESSKASEVQKPDYIHVRARRGQATDSHSLAERARREKISKKMKCLQDLVPGCNKVTGKSGMLDEIINYVQSLQKQVEFLSMKLAALNPRTDFNTDNFFAKEIPAYIASLSSPSQMEAATNSTCFQQNQMQQEASSCLSDMAMIPQKDGTSFPPIPEMFLDSSLINQLHQLSGWDSEWPSLFNVGFH